MSKHHLEGNFESGVGSWTSPSGTAAVSADQAKFGSQSLKFTAAGVSSTMYSLAVTLTATAFSLSGYIYIPTTYTLDGAVQFIFVGFTGATGVTAVAANMALRDQWQRVQVPNVTIAAGDLAGFIRITDAGDVPALGQTLYLDGVQLEDGAVVTDFEEHLTAGFHPPPGFHGAAGRLAPPVRGQLQPPARRRFGGR